jgi:hypothetical protein
MFADEANQAPRDRRESHESHRGQTGEGRPRGGAKETCSVHNSCLRKMNDILKMLSKANII